MIYKILTLYTLSLSLTYSFANDQLNKNDDRFGDKNSQTRLPGFLALGETGKTIPSKNMHLIVEGKPLDAYYFGENSWKRLPNNGEIRILENNKTDQNGNDYYIGELIDPSAKEAGGNRAGKKQQVLVRVSDLQELKIRFGTPVDLNDKDQMKIFQNYLDEISNQGNDFNFCPATYKIDPVTAEIDFDKPRKLTYRPTNAEILSTVKYESCPLEGRNNDYIEKQIQAVKGTNTDFKKLAEKKFNDGDFHRACSFHAMNRAALKGNGHGQAVTFQKCGVEDTSEGVPAPRPCITESYHKLVHNSFLAVNDCFGIDPKSTSGKIMAEGQFHINMKSHTQAGGLGQQTGPWISDVNKVYWENYKEHINNVLSDSKYTKEEKEACSTILPFLDKMKTSSKNFCDRVSLPENPVLNYFYAVVMFFESQKEILRPLLENAGLSMDLESNFIKQFKERDQIIAANNEIEKLKLELEAKKKEATSTNADRLKILREEISTANSQIESLNENIKKLYDSLSISIIALIHRDGKDPSKRHYNSARIATELAMYSHNAGITGMSDVFKKYIAYHRSQSEQPIQFANFTGTDDNCENLTSDKKPSSKRFSAFLYAHYNPNSKGVVNYSRSAEVANYIHQCVKKLPNGRDAPGRNDNITGAIQFTESLGGTVENGGIECSVF